MTGLKQRDGDDGRNLDAPQTLMRLGRGLALKQAGLEAQSVSGREMAVVLREILPRELAARAVAKRGWTVLLAPACSSLDMYRDYGARGDAFCAAVRALPEQGA